MNKKILAILMAFVIVVTCFAACKRHDYETTKINGQDVILYTDKDGNTVINDDNQIVAVVTDSDGELITFANGENQTYNIQISGSWVVDGEIKTKDFDMGIPSGWEGTENSRIVKEGTDGKCYIDFKQVHVLKDNEKFADAFEETDKTNEQIQTAFNNPETLKELIKNNPDLAKYEGCTYTIEQGGTTLTDMAYPCRTYVHKFVDADGKVVHYIENYYFLVSNTVYAVNYNCIDGEGYDADFNFGAFLKENFTFKG